MRLIDADALEDTIVEKWGVDPKYLDDSLDAMKDVQTLEWINSAPSIDIVRCKECKYASDDGTYGCMCEHFNDTGDAYHRMWSNDFCSRGEREGE